MSAKKSKKGPISAMEQVLGPTLLSTFENSEPTSTIMKDKDLVLLYFSASWCPPCKQFTPVLSEFYTKHCAQNKVEIVYISSDRDVESFKTYYNKMTFKSLPVHDSADIKQNIANKLKISGIPSLIVLEAKTGHFVTDNARMEVSAVNGSESGEELIQKWKDAEAVPIEEANLSGSGQGGLLWRMISSILKKSDVYRWHHVHGQTILRKTSAIGRRCRKSE
eukprot:734579_1